MKTLHLNKYDVDSKIYNIVHQDIETEESFVTVEDAKNGYFTGIKLEGKTLVVNENNEVLVKGISKWVIVNYLTRRISLTRDIDYNCIIHDETNFNEPFDKINDFDVTNLPYEETYIDYSLLDHNGHLNNINYARIVMNILKLTKEEVISKFEINYIKEVISGQTIRSYYKKIDNTCFIKGLVNNEVCYLAKVVIK